MTAIVSTPSVDDLSVTDLFCGAGGSSQGADSAGASVRMAVNHWQLAIDTHQTNFPNTKHDCADISSCDPRRYPKTRMLIASPECFPAGTLILTREGLRPIEHIIAGDMVLTHRGRWRPVTSTMQSVKDTVIVRGQGHYGLECSTEHPFYVRTRRTIWNNARRSDQFEYGNPEWKSAADLRADQYVTRNGLTDFWATPVEYHDGKIPIQYPDDSGLGVENPDFWWVIGRWLGDGSISLREKDTVVTICCGDHEADKLEQVFRFMEVGLEWKRRQVRTATLLDCRNRIFADWLARNFGSLAHGKRLPGWAFTMRADWAYALIQGYLSADGAKRREDGVQCMTVSRELAIGMRLLATAQGQIVALHRYEQHSNVIEGRHVNTRPFYHLAWDWHPKRAVGWHDDEHCWTRIKTVVPGHENVVVYNLSVKEDESYVADGIVVHNCTNHSLSKGISRKKQQHDLWGDFNPDLAAERSRATMWDVPRFCERHNYDICIIENVVEARSWVMWDAWIQAMKLLDYNYRCVYFNSMHALPTPQSRDRMYVVFWKKHLPAPNLDLTPLAWCAHCERNVNAVQSWKNLTRQYGHYRRQYVYCCPLCTRIVEPYYYCAANAIDWTQPIERIGDRKHPLKDKTIARIEAGLRKFSGQPFMFATNAALISANTHALLRDVLPTQTSAKTQGMVSPPGFTVAIDQSHIERNLRRLDETLPTMTTSTTTGVVAPFVLAPGSWGKPQSAYGDPLPTQVTQATPFLVDSGGAWESNAHTLSEPYATQTVRKQPGLVMPPNPPFIVEVGHGGAENAGRIKPIDAPLPTTHTLGGSGLVFPLGHTNGVDNDRTRDAHVSPMPTQTTRQEIGLATVPFALSFGSSQSAAHAVDEALQTQTTTAHVGLVEPFVTSYYGTDTGHSVGHALPTQPTHDRHALVEPARSIQLPDVDDCSFRVLKPHEIQRAMAFGDDYVVLGTNRDKIRQLGNAVTPPVMSLIVERCIEVLKR